MATKAEQSDATRGALVAAARQLFAEQGFADTSTEAVVQAAGVTRGALYHHFRDKTALFQAVYEDLEQELVARVAAQVAGLTDPLVILRRGCEAFLDACLDPAVLRVVLLEGPSVLGWETWREIDQAYGLGMVQATVEMAVQAKVIRRVPIEPTAHLLLGALVEGAMLMANAPDRDRTRADVGASMQALLDGLAILKPVKRAAPTRPPRKRTA
jgi:AcrR family transcriptional regulator